MSMQLVSLPGDRVTVKRIGDVFRKIIGNPDRIYSRSQNNTTITLSCPVVTIHDDDLGVSKNYARWTAEYRVRPRKEPAFRMSTLGHVNTASAEGQAMEQERTRYLEGLAKEIMSALEPTRFASDIVSIRLNVEYGQLTVLIDLYERD